MQDTPVTADDLHCAKMDRFYAMNPKLVRTSLRGDMIAAADANPSHKLAYKIHGAARRSKG